MKNVFTIVLVMLFGASTYAQQYKPLQKPATHSSPEVIQHQWKQNLPLLPKQSNFFQYAPAYVPDGSAILEAPADHVPVVIATISALQVDDNGLPTWISTDYPTSGMESDEDTEQEYLSALSQAMQQSDDLQFQATTRAIDGTGMQHTRMTQSFLDYPIWAAEVIIHKNAEGVIEGLNGHYLSKHSLAGNKTLQSPTITASEATQHAYDFFDIAAPIHHTGLAAIVNQDDAPAELMIFAGHELELAPVLAYHLQLYPHLGQRWEVFIDANTGEVIEALHNSCKLHPYGHDRFKTCHHTDEQTNSVIATGSTAMPGPATGSGSDLFGTTRSFGIWNEGSSYYMIDGARSMFNSSQSNMPSSPVGAIWTIDAGNTSPENSSFSVSNISSGSTNWNNPTAVSAHYNAGKAFDYYTSTFNRNSINGIGGNIVSIINVAESNGASMENAFWDGKNMYYGNGGSSFLPLARGLDVAGHEMSHGVVQATANLVYQGEPGALNESFADIFGAMIDRDDWKIGEDVVKTSAFPSGALRDMSNPNQGGSSLNYPGYQPYKVSQQYTGSQDNGGVHINSGIPNHAYYKYATAIGKDKSEQVFYHALSNYLTRNSNFKDCRIAVLKSAEQLYGAGSNEASQVASAFDFVEITGPSTGGGGGNQNTYENDLAVNPGSEYIAFLYTDDNTVGIGVPGETPFTFTSAKPAIFRPSITDDGSTIVYVASDHTLRIIEVDWNAGTADDQELESQTIWRNVTISKDGRLVAIVTEDLTDKVIIADLATGDSEEFTLYNPTFTQGVNTGAVEYAESLEFDYSGQNLMYDALNTINSQGGEISYWDISFINVWNGNSFAGGEVSKLFSTVPDNASIGNAVFSKNSPYIISFDYRDDITNEWYVVNANVETGESKFLFKNSGADYPAFPTFSRQDDYLGFDTPGGFFGKDIYAANLSGDKLEVTSFGSAIESSAQWSSIFANGIRNLNVDTKDVLLNDGRFKTQPNPATSEVFLTWDSKEAIPSHASLIISQLDGRVMDQMTIDHWPFALDVETWSPGVYILALQTDAGMLITRLIKS